MVAVPPRSVGPKLHDVRGNATELRLSLGRRGGFLWLSLFQHVPASRGPYGVWENIDRWAADELPGCPRLTLGVAQELLAEGILQRRLPGID